MIWYQLLFQFAGIAEATICHDDWAWLRLSAMATATSSAGSPTCPGQVRSPPR